MNNLDLTSRISSAIEQLSANLQRQAPFLSREVSCWIQEISPDGDASAHFTHVRMFPTLRFPEWIAESLAGKPDPEFQQGILHSSIHGYYYIRLIDDVMDGDRNHALEVKILSAAGWFCSQFQMFYQDYFPPEHEFWRCFRERWIAGAESAAHDASLRSVGWSEFERVASRKFSAAGIPVAAACHYYGQPKPIASWLEVVDELGRWSQMVDDLLDWHFDRRDQRATYFLCEGERRKRQGESLESWIAREGCAWAFELLEQWMRAMQSKAAELGSQGMQVYLYQKEAWLQSQKTVMLAGFAAISGLADILEGAPWETASGMSEECDAPPDVAGRCV